MSASDTTTNQPPGAPMPTAALGPGGPTVSRLALGTMTFGVETDAEVAHRQLDRFVSACGTLIDTADVYGGGESERIIGRWLADRRPDDVIVATKGRFAPPPGSPGASRRSLVRSVDASLARLGVDAIDLYFVHGWDADTPVEDTLDTLSGLVRAGKIHQLGWSNVTGWQLSRIMTTARLGGHVVPGVLQPEYNLIDREAEWELLPACLDENLAVTPWAPLGGGWLTGKYSRTERPSGATRLGEDPGRGVEAYDRRNTARTWRIVDAVTGIADRHGRPPAQVALAWLLARPGVASVLLGARTVDQLDQNLAAADLALTDDELAELTRVSAPGLPAYPYSVVEDFAGLTVWRDLGTHG
ncbi:MAG: aldo/keto reductase [Actinomycetota bacterium]|nr:aldo/keto reductase [Actinomycetota bacterium]